MSITEPFPTPPILVRSAYNDLRLAQEGTAEQKAAVGSITTLPRPWDPASCTPALRRQVWDWLEAAATWVNHEYCWQPDRFIPSCWQAHPHIAHELAVIADQRLTAGMALSADALEEWHRYALPAFLDRVAAHIGTGCTPGRHTRWPATTRHGDFTSDQARQERTHWFDDDTRAHRPEQPGTEESTAGRTLVLVDTGTGEVLDAPTPNGRGR